MDLKYIEDNNLNEARKRFQQINEYILNMNHESEAKETEDNMQQGTGIENQELSDGNVNQQVQPQQNIQQQGDNSTNDIDMSQQDIQSDEQEDLSIDPTIGSDSEDNGDLNVEDEVEDDLSADNDEVIDVDDLTQSQETAEYKIDGVDDKISQLIDIVSKFSQAIEDNDEKINDLKREIEERNPTQQERLNIRSMSGSPYTVSPNEYWKEQNARNPQYNVIADNDVDPDKEEDLYTITDDDIKNFNKSEIEKSISDFPKNLKDYF